ncbi:bifunctional riboflavin kinase/FAD synthetase [Scopulibacillus cellulosilyticus]|uniref:Riboflavin biosynthesis protein n=1 Tax=Scopulibacillus cellulosilyticus TaxID=2665665 RepID=A0ABW2PT52_9BACL
MEKIFLTHPPEIGNKDAKEKVIALGYFDGVHIGHQKVIKTAIEYAREKGLEAAVMTFHPHPSVVLKQLNKRENYLTPPEAKAELIQELGADLLYFVKFDEAFSQLSPQSFIDEYIIKLHAKHIVAGFDFTYGRMAKGTMGNIDEYSRKMFNYTVVPKVEYQDEKVSTTKIRSLISEGKVDEVVHCLGRHYQVSGTVVHGDKRGRTIGFPTANVKCDEPYVYPAKGVYAVKCQTKNGWYNGVCNVGQRPTFYDREQPITIEVFLLDFDGDIYDENIKVFWYKKLRDEKKFDGIDQLVSQIEKDKQQTIEYFSAVNS